ncbi:LPXTG cell wall anchor domain-containing protein [Nocardioides sp. MH1]|uniref:LPXTG cell wall anchor domain-containing protein n=1 Tax=Nocardioides sp. MH1 TaxID=3242490 RepID=UPI0035216348
MSRVLLGGAIALVLAATAAPACADEEVGVSSDGRHWHADLRTPLFDPAFRWVPGDRQVRSFYVRNQGPTRARMSLEVRSRDTGHLLPDDDVDLAARAAGGPWVELENGRAGGIVVQDALDAGSRVRVEVRVAFNPASTNQSEVRRLPLTFRVLLAQDGPGGDGPGSGPGGDGAVTGVLPSTGNGVQTWFVWLGAALVGAGLALVAAARRRGEEARDGQALC